MPWRGPEVKGEFPSLGHLIGDWIEAHCIIPDGPHTGEPFTLTDEMWHNTLHTYRLQPDATEYDGADALVYSGSQLIRPQKWGKDPLAAARVCAHAFGPVVPAGWDAAGEPVGMEHPTPWIACAAVADKQAQNTFRPVVTMLRDGPAFADMSLDIGLDRIKLPGDGWIETVPTNASTRLGGRFTYVTITESGLLVGEGKSGGVTFARAVKRNVGGMGGQWFEITNPPDPTENSVAQRTLEAKADDVFIDYRKARRSVPLEDSAAVLREVIYVYGDSAKTAGGWVSEKRIVKDVQNKASGENEVRRFFLQEMVSGGQSAVDGARWDALARDDDPLRRGEKVCLGFDGSRSGDATAIKIVRVRDGRWFYGRIWVPADYDDHKVPVGEVQAFMRAAFTAYEVLYVFADPYMWQDTLAVWAGEWPGRVVEFPTNVETRMDKAITRTLRAYRLDELTHDGHPLSSEHAKNAALAKGKRKPDREGEEEGQPVHYLKVVKKRKGLLIDDFVAGILGYEARAKAIEDGALIHALPPAVAVAAELSAADLFRPTERLRI